MREFLTYLQIFVSLITLFLILIQVKGVGLGRVWGTWSMSFSRRGLERLIFKATFVFAALFILVSILQLIV